MSVADWEHEKLTKTISIEEFEELDKRSLFVDALLESGIDNWCNYEYAIELYNKLLKEFEYENDSI